MVNNCIFCKIINKEIPAKVEYENEDVVAFDDIEPKSPIHILIVPRTHIGSISSLNNKDVVIVQKLIIAAKKIANKKGISDFRLVFNSGSDAGMKIDHLHLHLLGGDKLGSMA